MSKLIVRVAIAKPLKDTHYNLEKLNKHLVKDLFLASADYHENGTVLKLALHGLPFREQTTMTSKGKEISFDNNLPGFKNPRQWLIVFYDWDDLANNILDEPRIEVMSSDIELDKYPKLSRFFNKTLETVKSAYWGVFAKTVGRPENLKPNAAAPAAAAPAKKGRCPKGTRRNKKSGLCEAAAEPYVPFADAVVGTPVSGFKMDDELREHLKGLRESGPAAKLPRCPKGTRRNKKTGNCESSK
jgi:hypothetical protein